MRTWKSGELLWFHTIVPKDVLVSITMRRRWKPFPQFIYANQRQRVSITFCSSACSYVQSYVFEMNPIVGPTTVIFIAALRVLTVRNEYIVNIEVCWRLIYMQLIYEYWQVEFSINAIRIWRFWTRNLQRKFYSRKFIFEYLH